MDDPPTAIFAANDDMAAATCMEAQRRGLKLPDDLSVVGFDDAPIAAAIWPSLTTIRQPFDQMTQRAITALNAWNANAALGKSAATILTQHSLVIRESTGPAPRRLDPKPDPRGRASSSAPTLVGGIMNRQSWRGPALALMIGASAGVLASTACAQAPAAPAARPWLDPKLDADARADAALKAMTQDEKLTVIFGFFGAEMGDKYKRVPDALPGSAGYVPGIARLGIPAQFQTDAGVGVATQGGEPNKRERTALPSGMATTATWNPRLAQAGGAMIGAEARASGFNVMLAGGVNLVREPRNGRNFEYGGEDPWLAGKMVGAQIKGIQSNAIVSTIKHYALNGQETGRFVLDARIGEAEARTSDLLAFQFAIEDSDPHSVMCAYNRVNGDYACENDFLLNKVLKQDWGYKNYVMSDWGAAHSSAKAVNAGLDQESAGDAFDTQPFFKGPLKDALAKGEVSQARLDDMARRVLRGLFASGVVEKPVKIAPIDYAAHAKVTRADAEEGVVLLKNDKGLLPLLSTAKKIAVIGGHADVGVLSGGGSSQVYPIGGRAVQGEGPASWPGPMIYFPSSP
jgi:beta-glucosidase